MHDSQSDWNNWSPTTPEAIAERIGEIRSTVDSLDSTPPVEMSAFYYMHGFNELDLAVRDLLLIVESLQAAKEADSAGRTDPAPPGT